MPYLDWSQLAAQAALIGAGVTAIGYIAKSTTSTLVAELKSLRDLVTVLQKKSDDGDKFNQDIERELGGIQANLSALGQRINRVESVARHDRHDREAGDR